MANRKHLEILIQGVSSWNSWRQENYNILPDLANADISGLVLDNINFMDVDLRSSNLANCSLNNADFMGCILNESNLSHAIAKNTNFSACNLVGSDCRNCDFTGSRFIEATLIKTDFSKSNLDNCIFSRANMAEAVLANATLLKSYLIESSLIDANLNNANISGSKVYGIAVWNIQKEGLIQNDLIITDIGQPEITADDLEVAQFIHLIINNKKLREVFDIIASKTVLILGNFSIKNKEILDSIKNELKLRNYVSIVFDFDKPHSRTTTETVITLAKLSKFIVADLTGARNVPHELAMIIPTTTSVPIVSIISNDEEVFSMFKDFLVYNWVLNPIKYTSKDYLINNIDSLIIHPAEEKFMELKRNLQSRLESL